MYFGDMQNGYTFNYEPKEDVMDGANYESQITFLRLLSTNARQVWFFLSYGIFHVEYACI